MLRPQSCVSPCTQPAGSLCRCCSAQSRGSWVFGSVRAIWPCEQSDFLGSTGGVALCHLLFCPWCTSQPLAPGPCLREGQGVPGSLPLPLFCRGERWKLDCAATRGGAGVRRLQGTFPQAGAVCELPARAGQAGCSQCPRRTGEPFGNRQGWSSPRGSPGVVGRCCGGQQAPEHVPAGTAPAGDSLAGEEEESAPSECHRQGRARQAAPFSL